MQLHLLIHKSEFKSNCLKNKLVYFSATGLIPDDLQHIYSLTRINNWKFYSNYTLFLWVNSVHFRHTKWNKWDHDISTCEMKRLNE